MNWEAIGAIGEVLGAVAVILTLTYLAAQIRQNTRSTRATTYSDTTHGWHEYLQQQSVADIELLIDLTRRPSELTTGEFYRAYYLCRVMFRRMEHDYYQFKAGTFEADTWNAYVSSFREDTFNNAGVRIMWALQSSYLDPDFSRYMQRVVDQAATEHRPSAKSRFLELLAQQQDSDQAIR